MKARHPRAALLLAGAILASLSLAAAAVSSSSRMAAAPRPQLAVAPLEGAYSVEVDLEYVLPGVYGDALPRPEPDPQAPDLGAIELGLLLRQTGGSVTGYVDLGQTLVFGQEHTIQVTPVAGAPPAILAVGPRVTGTFDGTSLRLESALIKYTTGAGQRVERQFLLEGAASAASPRLITGQYRETLWGYGAEPFTVVGTFRLPLLSGEHQEGPTDSRIFLPIVRR